MATKQPYVLLALDQRGSGGPPGSWRTWLPAAHAVSADWPVKVLVTTDNLAEFEMLLDESEMRLGARDYRTEYALYRSATELRELTLAALMVITDLPHVAQWAKEKGIDVLSVQPDNLEWSPRSTWGEGVMSDLCPWLPETVRSDRAAFAGDVS